jgi:SAM-dependent methyltransferase
VDPDGLSAVPGGLQGTTYEAASGHLLWRVFTRNVLCQLPEVFRFCDAGGCGRWSLRILDEYAGASGVILRDRVHVFADAVANPLEQHVDRFDMGGTNLFGALDVAETSFDLTFSLQGILSSAEQPDEVLRELVKITKPGGFVVLLVPNMYHAVFCNLHRGRIAEAERAIAGRARYSPDTPELNVFTPGSLEALVKRAGACPRTTVGLPVVAEPWSSEADSWSEQTVHPTVFANEESRKRFLAIEEVLLNQSELPPRGSSLLSIATVPLRAQSWGDFWLTA